MENIGLGLLLMVVGMATTFIILLIIIWLSNGLSISLVNKFAPEEDVKKKPAASSVSSNAADMDAIKAAVDILTAGKGQVIKIEKL